MIIYMAKNKTNNQCYVGQTKFSLLKRKNSHVSASLLSQDSILFHQMIREYGPDNFEWEVLAQCDTFEILNRLEIFYIELLNTYRDGYNSTKGGRGIRQERIKQTTKEEVFEKVRTKEDEVKIEYKKKLIEAEGGKNNHDLFSVIIDDKYFSTIREAATFFNITPEIMIKKIEGKGYYNYNYASDTVLLKGAQQPLPSRHYVIRGGKRVYLTKKCK